MHIVAFMYPNRDGASFNYDHFVKVHLPLGVALMKKHVNLVPEKIVVYSDTRNGAAETTPPYGAISSVFFNNRKDAETFVGMFRIEAARSLLTADFPNYTPAPPEVLVAEVAELRDMDALIRTYERQTDESSDRL